MDAREIRWCLWAGIVAFLDIFLPFGLLRRNGTFAGSFLAWSLLTLAVVISGFIYTASWGRNTAEVNKS